MTKQNGVARNRRGMTLIEVIIAILIYGVIVSAAISFAAKQNTAFHRGLEIMTSLQNARYAVQALETDLIAVGTNLPSGQPAVVVAGANVIAFNADYASNVLNDVFASYIDVDAPNGQVTALRNRITIPNTSYQYPDTVYATSRGLASPGETIIFFFQVDTTTSRTDDYALYRKVNSAAPELVSRSILAASGGIPFFRYFRIRAYLSQASTTDSISDSALPIRHTATIHGSPADTATSALSDSIRGVRVSFRASNGVVGAQERVVEVSRVITFPNAGFGVFSTCGDEPMLGTGLTASASTLPGGERVVRLNWSAATDETAGEADVARYVIYRQETAVTADWGDPYLSIPPGQTTYEYVDENVVAGRLYGYALAAQDCTPMLSALTTSALITP